ncbi:hypothetical protein THIARS_60554 [Thiomonas delicata]|uniref:Uncharacterized protein n=1 Tax=Thiomonas delicata TaxID=364030 RepID=A0A238D3L9_THIDL|nr:hypothetical protein THIARS_60554 [Thiomonas delicata]
MCAQVRNGFQISVPNCFPVPLPSASEFPKPSLRQTPPNIRFNVNLPSSVPTMAFGVTI